VLSVSNSHDNFGTERELRPKAADAGGLLVKQHSIAIAVRRRTRITCGRANLKGE